MKKCLSEISEKNPSEDSNFHPGNSKGFSSRNSEEFTLKFPMEIKLKKKNKQKNPFENFEQLLTENSSRNFGKTSKSSPKFRRVSARIF